MTSSVVVVESPAKAKTINKYLGKDYQVIASYGHVRDLPSKDGSVLPDADFKMLYEVDDDAKKHITAIAKLVKGADNLYLATDPDREGEAISWHVLEALKESKSLPKNINVKRVVFTEITKKAVVDAVANPREIDMNLVNAQQARRALDYLVGFNLSPVLWRKLPGSRSAGRVQSVALRLICERDREIEEFISQEYWNIQALLTTSANAKVKTRLTYWKSEKLEKFSITHDAQANQIAESLRSKQFVVSSVEPKQVRRHPYAPFTTSTLQQEASRKLGFGAKKTMQLAQKLYEGINLGSETVGLITYMRTDGVTVSQEAIHATRDLVKSQYGPSYLPASQKVYKVKTTNAQEAHEAIRPTDVTRLPKDMETFLDKDMLRLYELIWKRMVASQMESAVYDQVIVDLTSTDKEAVLHTVGSVIKFDGFLKLYTEDKDDKDEDEDEESRLLPPLKEGESLAIAEITPEQHFTEPPPRFTEASLVKKLEELGIGRPSTYASIISVLQERKYVTLDKKRFIAEPLGRVVNAFLVSFFRRYVEYDFTAHLETELDEISEGALEWKQVLREFWVDFFAKIEEAKKFTVPQVLDEVDRILTTFLFPHAAEGKDPRICPNCGTGRLGLKTGKFGAFIGCSSYPECNYTRQLVTSGEAVQDTAAVSDGPKELGTDSATGLTIFLKKGPYGLYVQLGEEKKPKRASIPKTMPLETVTLEAALTLLSLPRDIGAHPETGKMIVAGRGRFGPYLLHDDKYTSIRGDDDILTIGINRAVTVIAEGAVKGAGRKGATPLKTLGAHPEDAKPVAVYEGTYGPYVKHGKINATLPKDTTPDTVTLEQAVELLAARAAKGPGGKGKKKKK